MNTKWIVTIVVLIIIVAAALMFWPPKASAPTTNSQGGTTSQGAQAKIPDLITVAGPLIGQKVKSPITVAGQARGSWYSEAVFPIEVLDAQGKHIGSGQGHAEGAWTTEDFVPFLASVTFTTQPAGSKGTLVLKNDNPSGDPAREKRLDIPVTF